MHEDASYLQFSCIILLLAYFTYNNTYNLSNNVVEDAAAYNDDNMALVAGHLEVG